MDVRRLIVATLFAESGCFFPGQPCGERYLDSFEVDQELHEEDLATALAADGVSDPAELSCETACRSVKELGEAEVETLETCTLTVEPADTDGGTGVMVQCSGTAWDTWVCKGRRPLGHVERSQPPETLGERFAHDAYLEAASALAFVQLARQLADLCAPSEMIARCRRAAAEEREHARLFTNLARRAGAAVPRPRLRPAPTDLEAIARHNATEGCVGETWAALEARWQAAHSPDPLLRRVFERIANDEASHAQLAWDLHAWLLERLSPGPRAAVVAALDGARAALPGQVVRRAGPPDLLGGPSPDQARRLATRFAAGLMA